MPKHLLRDSISSHKMDFLFVGIWFKIYRVIKMKKFDLHMHSNYSSDGELTPSQLIEIAKKRELEVVALSDHNEIKGIKEMTEEGKKAGIRVIPAIEFSTLFDGDIDCHLLGYGLDINLPYFQDLGAYTQKLADDAFHERVVKLEKTYSIQIDEEQVIKDAHGENPWFLMCKRIFENPEYAHIEDFKDYLPNGKRSDPAPVNFFWDKCQKGSPLYVFVKYPSFEETVKRIHDAGGIAVLAHPFKTFYQNEAYLSKAIEAGIDGIEAYSNYHEPMHNEYYAEFAKKHGLLITCGSDFHGKHKPSIVMGEYGYDGDDADSILEAFSNRLDGKR